MFWIEDFLSLVYPNICALCGNSLWRSEEVICQKCEYHLPKTNFHLESENPVSRLFWGRVMINGAAAFLYFNKGNATQELIHKLKYRGRKDIGIFLGNRYGLYLRNTPLFSSISCIIPVPLHRKKEASRGYNQSEQFGMGLSTSMGVPVMTRELVRSRETSTQTKKSRFQRWENVAEKFTVIDPQKLEGTHVLLVDDVITTGATLEACVVALAGITGIRVSVAAIAIA